MKAKKLISKLQQVIKVNPNSEVVLYINHSYRKFTGFSVDDKNDVELYITPSDKTH